MEFLWIAVGLTLGSFARRTGLFGGRTKESAARTVPRRAERVKSVQRRPATRVAQARRRARKRAA